MQFEYGETYLIDYGVVSKPATFIKNQDGNNHFFDISGEFTLSDEFISRGKVTISELYEDWNSIKD